jgi:hypothetical protein
VRVAMGFSWRVEGQFGGILRMSWVGVGLQGIGDLLTIADLRRGVRRV